MCSSPSGLRCGLGGDRPLCGGGWLQVRGSGFHWFGGLIIRPMCPVPSGPRWELGGDRLLCGGGRIRLKDSRGNWRGLLGPDFRLQL